MMKAEKTIRIFLFILAIIALVFLCRGPASAQTDCACTATYPLGTNVTLTAAPTPGCVWTGWGGACSGTAPTCSVTMDQAKNVSAIFTDPGPVATLTIPNAAISLTVPITIAATGCKPVAGYFVNESASTPALTDANWKSSAPSSYTFTSAGNKTLYLWAKSDGGPISKVAVASTTITLPNYIVTITKSGTGTGTVTSVPAGVNCGINCSTSLYKGGQGLPFVATPDKDSTFKKWTGNACNNSKSVLCMLPLPIVRNLSLNAQFDKR